MSEHDDEKPMSPLEERVRDLLAGKPLPPTLPYLLGEVHQVDFIPPAPPIKHYLGLASPRHRFTVNMDGWFILAAEDERYAGVVGSCRTEYAMSVAYAAYKECPPWQ